LKFKIIIKNISMKANPFNLKIDIIKEIQKGDIFETMCTNEISSKEPIYISKTSTEIKDQINTILMPSLLLSLELKKNELIELLSLCGGLPKNEVHCYKMKLDIPFKEYSYNETYLPYKSSDKIEESSLKQQIYQEFTPDNFDNFEGEKEEVKINLFNWPLTEEQAKYRISYNELLRNYIEIFTDVKTLIALEQIEDNKLYNLTINQVISLGFTTK